MTLDIPSLPSGKQARVVSVLVALLVWLCTNEGLSADFDSKSYNGFNLGRASVPVDQIRAGGPPRDGIPSIDRPRFITAEEADFLGPEDRVMGVVHNGLVKAYPIKILNWHEIVNDDFGNEAVVISYCPLCGTGMAFSAEIDGRDIDFGVSGLLYNSDVLLYDRSTLSLWSQIMREAVSGTFVGTELTQLPASHTTWRDWRKRHPDTRILSRQTGYSRNYAHSPYGGYEESGRIWFPVAHRDERYHPKEKVIGLQLRNGAKAYPFAELSRRPSPFADQVGGRHITVHFDERNRTGRIVGPGGKEIPSTIAYWFAWVAFHPDTAVFQAH